MAPTLPLVRGTLDLLVLRALLGKPMHGYEITAWIDRHSHDNLAILDSALYQALYRLEKQRLISAEWGVTDNNRQARYYRVTASGRRHLRAETSTWLRYASTITALLTAPLSAS
jgi:PadR family transcriptional regulator, regulatory protein PadR